MDAHRGVWILAEQKGGRIQRISHELLTRGRALADKRDTPLTAVVLGWRLVQVDLDDLIARGADRVLAVEDKALAHFLPDPFAACLGNLIRTEKPEIIIAGATSTGRTLMPLVAVQVGAGLTADCTLLDIEEGTGHLLQTRPAIGGNILATINCPDHRPQMATVRPRSTPVAQPTPGRKGEIVRLKALAEALESRVVRVAFEGTEEKNELGDADVVVAVGRGIKRAENLKLVQPLVKALGAALGASRDVIDRGWLSYPHQVGLSGKTVAPKLYIALGISGAIQHLAGMQTAETIIAVNSDPDAQIFKVADYGVVGDLFEVVPALAAQLQRIGGL
jgi:electron transfer flavoprotein alpha subunit